MAHAIALAASALKLQLVRWRLALLPILAAALLRMLRRKRKLPISCSFLTVLRCHFSRKTLELHHEFANKVGRGCWTIKVPHDPRIFATVSPDIVDHILIRKFTNYDKGPQWRTALHDLLGHGIFNADGSMWKMQRKVASHEFSVRSLRDFMFAVFHEHATAAAALVQAACRGGGGGVVDVQDLFARYTLDSIGQIGFGVKIGVLEDSAGASATAEQFSQAFDAATKLSSDRFVDPLWQLKRLLNVGSERRMREAISGVRSFSDRIIAERYASSAQDLASRSDLLSRYMRYISPEGKEAMSPTKTSSEFNFTPENLRDIVINFVLAGRDTTANLLTWSVFELAQHPEVVESLRQEAKHVRSCGSQLDAEGLGFESFSRMPYLQATLTEVLRLHPSVPLDFKTVNEDDVLPDGTQVYAGERIMFVTWSMGRQPDLWEEPDSFKPTRFLSREAPEGNGEEGSPEDAMVSPKGTLRFRFPPASRFPVFHAGPRTCLGKDSAYLGAGVVLSELLERFDFELETPRDEVGYDTGLTLWIHGGLNVRFREREASAGAAA